MILVNKKYIAFIFILSVFLNSCASGMLGVPDIFKGYYISEEAILDNANHLIIFVANGSLTMYLGSKSDTNISNSNRQQYASVSPYNIIGMDYSYTFETGKMTGFINFDGRDGANISITEYSPPSTYEGYCRKVN